MSQQACTSNTAYSQVPPPLPAPKYDDYPRPFLEPAKPLTLSQEPCAADPGNVALDLVESEDLDKGPAPSRFLDPGMII